MRLLGRNWVRTSDPSPLRLVSALVCGRWPGQTTFRLSAAVRLDGIRLLRLVRPPMEKSCATRCPDPVRPHCDRPPADRLRRLGPARARRPTPPAEVAGWRTTVTQFWPLTGLKVPSNKTAELDHPVLVAKMDNTVSSQPQVGLSKADMVVEELVEGGLTRLAAFYYSDIPGIVGPIRSMRASDIAVVSPVHASMVTSGAAAQTIARIKAAASRSTPRAPRASTAPRSGRRRTTCSPTSNGSPAVAKRKPATPPDYLDLGRATRTCRKGAR